MNQEIYQSQKLGLKMTLNLQHYINLLNLSSVEINEIINIEVEKNPFLEIIEKEPISYPIRAKNLSIEDVIVTSKESLKTFVLKQLAFLKLNLSESKIAFFLIDSLNDDGYLEEPLDAVSSALKVDIRKVEEVLLKLQKLEPIGLFARDLKECISLQLKEKGFYNAKIEKILNELVLISKHEYETISNKYNINRDEVLKYVKLIKTLNPKPGKNIEEENIFIRVPEAEVRLDKVTGEITCLWYKESVEEVRLNDYYSDLIKKNENSNDTELKKYLHTNYNNAKGFIKALDKRKSSILAICAAIAKLQEEFFKKGIMHLAPMAIKDIAEITLLSESTISRITSNKCIMTPYGVVDMKFFFSKSLESARNDASISSSKAKSIIKKLVELEEEVLSDEEIADFMLNKFKIKIARRTVAKYRDLLKIPPSSIRKRLKIL